MSWDVLIFAAPPEIQTMEQMGADFHSELGPRDEVLGRLRRLFPEIDLSDPAWANLLGPGFAIELNIGDKDPVDSILLHVRGSDDAVGPIRQLCEATGWRAMDMADCEFLRFDDDPAAGLRAWRGFRDRAVEAARAEGAAVADDPVIGGQRVDAAASRPRRRPWWRFWR